MEGTLMRVLFEGARSNYNLVGKYWKNVISIIFSLAQVLTGHLKLFAAVSVRKSN